ncbi:hypothetical protein P700755_003115 [Psychroflexus torquis ATCC 700755]|uniref:AraC family transcriptional regulator n=1 Tax=Psychroflexus torquis (strain ATCC 700755 / CIP 106069 / ACAM 623) TaxID=313595 RepID=K4IWD6_PSYTT|nr:hypothetical protein [Psychroflexus torquis]AFU69785.1 hypothetical protein P700755_003115 [Psychroflexus torquis ATCC 700755]
MKFFKYIFFLIVLLFVVGSLYIATVNVNNQETINFETPINAKLFESKIKDFSTYSNWFTLYEDESIIPRLSNPNDFENSILSWQNSKFESINLQNKSKVSDSLVQQLTLKTWLSLSEIDITWKFKTSENNSSLILHLESDASFWQKAETVFTGISHLDIAKTSIENSLSSLERSLQKEISVYDIAMVGKVETSRFYLLHATSAAKLNYNKILEKSEPIFKSIEDFMKEQKFEIYKGRLILFENLYENTDNLIFSPGIGSQEKIAIPDTYEILSKSVSQGAYFKTKLTGDYINMEELIKYSNTIVANRSLKINTRLKPFLEFEISSNSTVNPSKWITNYYIPIIE